MRITGYEAYTDYFKWIATNLKLLNPDNNATGNFFEFEESFKGTGIKGPALILVPPVSNWDDKGSDNELKSWTGQLWILEGVPKQDPVKKRAAILRCEAITNQIRKKMKDDYQNYSLGSNRPFVKTDPNKWEQYQMSLNVTDLMYGYALEFMFSNPDHTVIDNTMWW